MDIVKKFLESGKSEIYFKVGKMGKIGTTDDSLHLIKKDNNDVPIENTVEIVTEDKNNKLLMEKVKFKTYHHAVNIIFLKNFHI